MDLPTEDKPSVAGAEREMEGINSESKVSKDEGKDDGKSDAKITYKSFKKKYRKMRVKFDDIMRESNLLYEKEHQGFETAKRLARENDQLLEMLLDMNDSPQMPIDKRIDLDVHTPTPSLSSIPSLVSSEERAWVSQSNNTAADSINKETLAMIDAKTAEKVSPTPPKSFQKLLENTPHITAQTSPQDLLAELQPIEGCPGPIAYLTVEQIDEYVYNVDVQMGVTAPQPIPPPRQDLAHRNPHSVYNWLRQHEPKVFLQDGEGSEKSHGKPGSLRGAGKRASMPYPSKPDALEIVEEDGLGYDPTIAGLEPATKGNKRKREEDGGYHPKLGAPDGKSKKPRPRKKKADGPAETSTTNTPTSSKRAKGKAKVSSPAPAEAVEPVPSVGKPAATKVREEEEVSRSSSPDLHKGTLPSATQ